MKTALRILLGLAAVAILVVGFVVLRVRKQIRETNEAAVPSVAPRASELEMSETQLTEAKNLSQAAEAALPMMGDVAVGSDGPSYGATELARWMAGHPNRPEIRTAQSTISFSEVLKDSDAARGRLFCASGKTIEIARVKGAAFTLYTGGLIASDGSVVRFLVPEATDGIVANTPVRLCGVVIGTVDYANSMGGVTHAVQIVGSFVGQGKR